MRTKKMITKLIAVTVSMALLCPGMVFAETLEEPSLQEDGQAVLEDIGEIPEDVSDEPLNSDGTEEPDTYAYPEEGDVIEADSDGAINISGEISSADLIDNADYVLSGNCTININADKAINKIDLNGKTLTVKGAEDKTLTVKDEICRRNYNNHLTVESGNLSTAKLCSNYFNLSGGTVTVEGNDEHMTVVAEEIEVSGGSLNVTNNGEGTAIDSNKMTISGGQIKAVGGYAGINCDCSSEHNLSACGSCTRIEASSSIKEDAYVLTAVRVRRSNEGENPGIQLDNLFITSPEGGVIKEKKNTSLYYYVSNNTEPADYVIIEPPVVISTGEGDKWEFVNGQTKTLSAGQNITVNATVNDKSLSGVEVEWESDNTGIATVVNGVVTGVKPGKARITATATEDGKSQSAHFDVKVTAKDISKADISGVKDMTYTGKAITQSPTVTLDGKKLTKGTDYTISYTNNTNAGTATMTITGEGKYAGSKEVDFTINKANQTITASDFTKTTTDAPFSIGAKASGGGTLSYESGNTKVATVDNSGKVIIKGVGKTTIAITAAATKNYNKTTKTIDITVNAKEIGKASVSGINNKTYTGNKITQSPTVKLDGKTLKKGTDYTLSYKDNINAGTATVIITGKGNYKGTVTKTFKIKQADNKLNVTAKKKTHSVSYSKKKKNEISGNDIYKFTKKNKTKGTIKYTLSSVKKGKKKVKKGFSVSKSNGKLTIKAGVAKGSYKITVKVTAGDKNYKTVKNDVKFTVEVK